MSELDPGAVDLTVFPMMGRVALLGGVGSTEAITGGLYLDDYTPSATDPLMPLVEPSGAWYSRLNTPWGPGYASDHGFARRDSVGGSWLHWWNYTDAPSEPIYGIFAGGDGVLYVLWAARFIGAPIVLWPGDVLDVHGIWSLTDLYHP